MLQYLTKLFYALIFSFVYISGIYIYGYILANLFAKLKLQDYFNIDDMVTAIVVLSVVLTFLSFKLCHWYFKRLKNQKDD